jgi:putative tricarboxylic transport membrane protein
MTKDDRACALILLGIAIATCLGASRHVIGTFDDPGPGLFPMILGAVLGVLSLIIFTGGIIAKRSSLGQVAAGGGGRGRISKEAVYVISALVAYGFLLIPLGFILTTLIVFAGLLKLVAGQKWPMVVGGSVVLALGSYFVFATLLGVPLPQGILTF